MNGVGVAGVVCVYNKWDGDDQGSIAAGRDENNGAVNIPTEEGRC